MTLSQSAAGLPVPALLQCLGGSEDGLSAEAVARRLAQYGYNELKECWPPMEIYGKGPHPERIGGWLVYGVEAHSHETLKNLHEEISQHLTPADAILLLGLGQPKHQLAKFISEQGSHLGHIAQIDTVPRLTEAELVAHAEAFFHVGFGQVVSPN